MYTRTTIELTSRLVKARSSYTPAQTRSSASFNLEVDTLWVSLSAIGLASSVESDDLVPDDIVARSEGGRDRRRPGVVGLDEIVGHPGTGVVTGFPGTFVDLGPEERCWSSGAAVSLAVRDVVEHRS